MQLVGRKTEIKNLEWDLQKAESQFVAIYGRRRIGKTYLVREMFNDSFAFSHTGLRGGDRKAQLAAFRASQPEMPGPQGLDVRVRRVEQVHLLFA